MSLRVLIVDDEPVQREALRSYLLRARALAAFALQIDEAADGAAGLACFRASPFDVVIVDLLLPKLDGAALCRALRREPKGADAVVLAISGVYRDAPTSRRLWDDAQVELLSKPLDFDRFAGRLLALLGRRKESDPEGARRWLRPSAQAEALPAPGPAAGEPLAMVAAPTPLPTAADPTLPAARAEPAPAPVAQSVLVSRSPAAGRATAIVLGRAWSGELGAVELSAVLVTAAEQRATGVLTLARGKLRKVIYLEAGRAIYVDSNLRHEALGAYLVESGLLTEAQLEQGLRVARHEKSRLGEALVKLGAIDTAALDRALAAQVQVKLAGALRWDAGQISFAPGASALAGIPRYPVEPVPWVLAALERLLSVEEAGGQVEALADDTIQLTESGHAQVGALVAAYGKPVVDVASGQRPLRHFLEAVGDRERWVVRVAALLRSGLVEPREAPTAAPETTMLTQAAAAEAAPETALGEAVVPAAVMPAAVMPAAVMPAAVVPAAAVPAAGAPRALAIVEAPPVIPDALGAELLYREALTALSAGDAGRAVATLRRAVLADPSQPDYHALLGWALFVDAGADGAAAAQAAEALAQAFALHPAAVLAHELAARVADCLGDRRRAAEHLAIALKHAPLRLDLLSRAREVLTALGDFAALERLYRKVLGAVREGSGIDVVGLWVELAFIYRDGLGRVDNARVALGVAERLAADDPRVHQARRVFGPGS
ncbi:MAG: response regulator [Proteobacteria bacterium]|nr:response regulator [Pseudomonadota bacterium]